jgi:hypothetical protein
MVEEEGCMDLEIELSRFLIFDEKEEYTGFLDCPLEGFVFDKEGGDIHLVAAGPKDVKSKQFLKDNFNYKEYKETKVNKCKTKKKK